MGLAERQGAAVRLHRARVVGSLVRARWFVEGYPVGLGTDTLCRVVEHKRHKHGNGDYERVRLERDDGREGSWWVNREGCVRLGGEPL